MTIFWAINKADYFIYDCDKLFIGTDQKPLVAFLRKDNPKPLDQIVNKRLRKYVSEINQIIFTIFHISGVKNFLSNRGSRFPSGRSGDDRGDSEVKSVSVDSVSTVKSVYVTSDSGNLIHASSAMQALIQADVSDKSPRFAQIFAYVASGPANDADYLTDDIDESDDYVSQAMLEVASILSISAGRQVSVAMTVEKLKSEIQSDSVYKYLRQKIAGSIQVAKYVGELAVFNYHQDNLTVSPGGLIMYKTNRFFVPKVLRAGLLMALHSGHSGVLAMVLRAKETFWWPNLKGDIEQVRAKCLLCHQNAPSQAKEHLRVSLVQTMRSRV